MFCFEAFSFIIVEIRYAGGFYDNIENRGMCSVRRFVGGMPAYFVQADYI